MNRFRSDDPDEGLVDLDWFRDQNSRINPANRLEFKITIVGYFHDHQRYFVHMSGNHNAWPTKMSILRRNQITHFINVNSLNKGFKVLVQEITYQAFISRGTV